MTMGVLAVRDEWYHELMGVIDFGIFIRSKLIVSYICLKNVIS